jgi:small subunit ribosomal protein S1
MQQQTSYNWDEDCNIFVDGEFSEKEAMEFRQLLRNTSEGAIADALSAATGKIISGIVIELNKDFAVVDVGLKSEGLVPLCEFSPEDRPSIGQSVDVYIENLEDAHGQIILSKEKADRQKQWDFIVQNCEEGSIVTGRVLRKVKGGLMVDIGVEAFLPGSQIDNKRIKNIDEYLNETYDFKIIKINLERKNIVLSRRELLEAERISKKTEMLEMIQPGEARRGVVKNITDFGVFLDLNGVDGLLHITDMTWKRIRHPSEMVSIGQELHVVVLSVDKDKGRVALGLKQKEINPWEQIRQKYPAGSIVKGKIVNLVSYGAFMEIEPGIEGLIHSSEMSWVRNVTDPSEVVQKGQEIEAIVKEVQVDEGKISLSIKEREPNPWNEVEKKYPVGSIVDVVVRNLTNYGAFVELAPGIDGLVHISDLSWVKKISHPCEVLKKGDKLKAMVLSIDRDTKKITLGVKQLSENPWDKIKESLVIGKIVAGTVTKTTAFGVYVEIEPEMIEALVPAAELSDQPFGKVEEVVSKGNKITARITRIEPEHKKVYLSCKELKNSSNEGTAETSRDDIVIAHE